MAAAIGLIIALALLALGPGAAEAVVPLAPAESSSTSSTPTFTWRLAAGEQASNLEVSPNPAPGDNGGFTDDRAKRTGALADTQTSYAIGNQDPLFPGVWFWHVSASGPEFDTRWSPLRRIVVRDEPIALGSFKVSYYECLRKLNLQFDYEDNSAGLPATYQLEFRRSRRGRRAASLRGRAEGGRFFELLRKPRRLRAGRRYYMRLNLRDAGAHVARSGFRRVRISRCG